jgi:hypothetical protein
VFSASENHQDGTSSYANLRLRFEQEVAAAVIPTEPWYEAVVAIIRAALTVAAADPPVAHRLTVPATGRRSVDLPGFTEAVDDLGARLRRRAPAPLGSERAAHNFVLRVARQVCLQLETRPDEPVTALAPDLIVLALTPCVGLVEARRLADPPTATS